MISLEKVWELSISELFGLAEVGIDDADTDGECALYASDGVNGSVYKITPDGGFELFSVSHRRSAEEGQPSLNIAVAPDSSFCIADAASGSVCRYNARGEFTSEFPAPGVLSLCQRPEHLIYVLTASQEGEQIIVYDPTGAPAMAFPAPARHRAHLDPTLANLDADRDGNVYMSYGMPPYRIWKATPDGEIQEWSREFDYPEDAVLISDIAVDPARGILWALLACRQSGLQVLDAWTLDGEYLGASPIPQSRSLYGVMCAAGDSELYLLDTSSGAGSGTVLRLLASL